MLEKSPAFQFYPKDFLTDSKVIVMSPEVKGLYITLLCIDWLEDGFPVENMLKLSGYEWFDNDGTLRDNEFHSRAIALLSPCFDKHPTKPGFITNKRLQSERLSQLKRRQERAKSGTQGAKSRWDNKLQQMAEPCVSHALANGKSIANDGSSSSSSSSSSSIVSKKVVSLEVCETAKPPKPSRKISVCDSEWFQLLKSKDAYKNVNIEVEFEKAALWASERKRICTRQFFLNWLNRIPAAMNVETQKQEKPIRESFTDRQNSEFERKIDTLYDLFHESSKQAIQTPDILVAEISEKVPDYYDKDIVEHIEAHWQPDWIKMFHHVKNIAYAQRTERLNALRKRNGIQTKTTAGSIEA